MSRKRENAPVEPDAPAKSAKIESEGASNQEPTTISASQSDGIKNLDTIPAIQMNEICRFLVDAKDYKALDFLRKANKGCKAAVDSFLKQKKNILPMERIDIWCSATRFIVNLYMQVDTVPLRPNLEHIKNAARFVDLSEYDDVTTCIYFPMRTNDENLMDAFNEVVGTVRRLFFKGLTGVRQLQFINRELFGKWAKFDTLKIELDKYQPISDEFGSELFSTLENHSIEMLELHLQPRRQRCELTDPMGFVERLTQLTKSVEINQHQTQRAPLLFNIPQADWKNMAQHLHQVNAKARFRSVRGEPITASSRS